MALWLSGVSWRIVSYSVGPYAIVQTVWQAWMPGDCNDPGCDDKGAGWFVLLLGSVREETIGIVCLTTQFNPKYQYSMKYGAGSTSKTKGR